MSHKKLNYLGLFSGLIAALGWATIGLWVKNISLDYFNITVARFVVSGVLFFVCLGFAFLIGKKVEFKKDRVVKALGIGILLFITVLLAIYSFKELSIGQATVLTNIHLLFIVLFSIKSLIKNGKLLHLLVGIFFLMLGIQLIFGGIFELKLAAISAGVICSFLFACFSFLSEKHLKGESDKYLGFMFLAGGMLGLIFADTKAIVSVDASTMFNLLALCIITSLISNYAYLFSVKSVGSLEASILSYFTILFGVLIEVLVNKEIDINQIGGTFIVFVSLIFLLFVHHKTTHKT